MYFAPLDSSPQPVAVKNIEVAVTVQGYIAEVCNTAIYKNEEKSPIEAVFVFPVDDQSAVYKFQAVIDGRLIEAECQEKEQVQYDSSLGQYVPEKVCVNFDQVTISTTLYDHFDCDDFNHVAVKNIEVAVTVQGYIAEVCNTAIYKNEEKSPIEAVFVFPVDDQSAVYKFQAVIDGRLIEAECQEKEQARATYEEAIQTGHSAFLLQESETSGDIFECRVGNLPPKKEAKVSFAYVIELGVEANGDTKFIYPWVLCPRYTSTREATGTGVVSRMASRLSQWVMPRTTVSQAAGESPAYTTGVVINVYRETETELTVWLESAKDYNASYSEDGATGKMTVVNPTPARDLIVYIRNNKAFSPHVLLEKGDASNDSWFLQKDIAMVNLCPSFDGSVGQVKGEYIFIVDRSGSMSNSGIHYARKALGEFLCTIPEDCYFNIISFGSTVEALFGSGSVKKTNATLKEAKDLQKTMGANMGGTEMMLPFELIYGQPVIEAYPRQIFLLTDGSISNPNDLISLVKQHQAQGRVFTFGIGSGASTSLVFGIARAGRGRAEFITDDLSTLPEKVKRTLKCAMTASVENVALNWRTEGEIEVTKIPQKIPPIFQGERLIVYGLIKNLQPASETITVELSGKINGQTPLSLPPVTFHITSEGSSRPSLPIHRLAAKGQIKELQDKESHTDSKKDQIVLLSCSANIVSKHTAFVGVDKRTDKKLKVSDKQPRCENRPVKSNSRLKLRGSRFRMFEPSSRTQKCFLAKREIDEKAYSRPTPSYVGIAYEAPTREIRRLGASRSPQTADIDQIKGYNIGGHGAVQSTSTKPTMYVPPPPRAPVELCCEMSPSFHSTSTKPEIPPTPTDRVMFAPWQDARASIYRACVVDDENKLENSGQCTVKFIKHEMIRKSVLRSALVSATVLSPGDTVQSEHAVRGVETGLILKYEANDDVFLTAKMDGSFERYRAEDLMLLPEHAVHIKDRESALTSERDIYKYTSSHDALPRDSDAESRPSYTLPDVVKISTSDLRQLVLGSRISNTLVEFYLSYFMEKNVSEVDRKKSYIFSSQFFRELSDAKDNKSSRARFEAVRPGLKNLNPYQHEMLVVPILDRNHCYAIVVKVDNAKPTTKEEPIRCTLSVMDSDSNKPVRTDEVTLLKDFLVELFAEQVEQPVNFEWTVKYPEWSPQQNNRDGGLCMLLCIQQCFKDNLSAEPDLSSVTDLETQKLRQEMAQIVMRLWSCQSTKI